MHTQQVLTFNYFSQDRQHKGEVDNNLFLADILAYEGKFSEAAKLYHRCGKDQAAMNMYTDLRMFDLAQLSMSSGVL
ncbi:Intraflagellar transport protein 122 [Portunus trituberculatus]|uniref:Intraflagellar transport protein 122 n=1 Tax=Portunus trituberculatus TaxID=210409 RepID=A0A5B7HTH0_PORTR|nr:Intraflagellar transport protein 122 [Portunus trituberculatus]